MSRSLATDFKTALSSDLVRLAILVKVDTTVPFNVWTGSGELTIEGDTYVGAGELLSISPTKESSISNPSTKTLSISGLATNAVPTFLAEDVKNKQITIKIAVFNEGGTLASASTHTDFVGFIEQVGFNISESSFTISVSCIEKFQKLFKPAPSRYTPEDQKAKYPGDLGLDYIPTIQDNEIVWKAA